MEKYEIDTARAQAAKAVDILAPLVGALQNAFTVLSTMSSAEKYRVTLVQDTALLEAQIQPLRDKILQVQQEVVDARATAALELSEVNTDARGRVEHAKLRAIAAEKQAEIRVAEAAQKAAEETSSFATQVLAERDAHDQTMANMFGQKQQTQEELDTLEKRIADAREQARQVIASLTG